jgi:hypothetical protein
MSLSLIKNKVEEVMVVVSYDRPLTSIYKVNGTLYYCTYLDEVADQELWLFLPVEEADFKIKRSYSKFIEKSLNKYLVIFCPFTPEVKTFYKVDSDQIRYYIPEDESIELFPYV